MEHDRQRIINTVCIIISILLLVGMSVLLFLNNQKQQNIASALAALEAEAAPYQSQKSELQKTATEIKRGIYYERDKARLMVGFTVSEPTDASYIRELSAQFGFSPICILDCSTELESIKACIDACEPEWEIMYYAELLNEASINKAKSISEYLSGVSGKDTGVFFLRGDSQSKAGISLLRENGFSGYTLYHDNPTSWQSENGLVYFDYSHIRTEGSFSAARLAECYANKISMLFVFDLPSIKSDTLSKEKVLSVCEELSKYASYDDCDYATVSETLEVHSVIQDNVKEQKETQEKLLSELQVQIDELNRKINEIYSR